MTTEDQELVAFAEKFEDMAYATRNAPGLFKRAFRLHKKGVSTFGLTVNLISHIQKQMRGSVENFPKIMTPTMETLINYSEHLLRFPKGVERAKAARKLMENVLSEYPLMRRKSVCKNNCSACCHMKPYATDSEADLILEYVAENGIQIDKARLQKQVETRDNYQHVKNLSWEDSACVFLSSEGSCNIYPVRPLTCMKHFIMSNPEKCDPRVSMFQELGMVPKAEILSSAFFNIETPEGKEESESLPELILRRI